MTQEEANRQAINTFLAPKLNTPKTNALTPTTNTPVTIANLQSGTNSGGLSQPQTTLMGEVQRIKQTDPRAANLPDEQIMRAVQLKREDEARQQTNTPSKNEGGLGLIGSSLANTILGPIGNVFSNPNKVKDDTVDTVKGFTSPFRTVAATLVRGTEALPTQVKGVTDWIQGGANQERLLQEQKAILDKPFLGAKSVQAQSGLENIGTAGEVGSTLLPFKGVGTGLLGGFVSGTSSALKEGEDIPSAIKTGVLTSAPSALLGRYLGKGSKPISDTVTESAGKVLQVAGGESESGVRGYLGRQGRNLERAATQAPIVDKETSTLAKVAGLPDEYARDYKALNPETKKIMSDMTEEAEKTGSSLKPKNRMEFVGKEVTKRASKLNTIFKTLGNKYNAAIVSSNVDPVQVKQGIANTTSDFVQALQEQGVTVTKAGKLNFKNSNLNSENLKAERSAIESIWADLQRANKQKNPNLSRLHAVEKNITGNELPYLTKGNEGKTLVQRVRDTARNNIDTLVGSDGKYKKLVSDYRKAKTVEAQIEKTVNSSIGDALEAGLITQSEADELYSKDLANKLSRLPNKAGVPIETFLQSMENGLAQLGVEFPPLDYKAIANYNLHLDNIVGASQRGSAKGLLQDQGAGIVQGISNLASGNAKGVVDQALGATLGKLGSVTKAEQLRALKLLLR